MGPNSSVGNQAPDPGVCTYSKEVLVTVVSFLEHCCNILIFRNLLTVIYIRGLSCLLGVAWVVAMVTIWWFWVPNQHRFACLLWNCANGSRLSSSAENVHVGKREMMWRAIVMHIWAFHQRFFKYPPVLHIFVCFPAQITLRIQLEVNWCARARVKNVPDRGNLRTRVRNTRSVLTTLQCSSTSSGFSKENIN